MLRKALKSWSPEVPKFQEVVVRWFKVQEKHGDKLKNPLKPEATKCRSMGYDIIGGDVDLPWSCHVSVKIILLKALLDQ
jgi:hypothetical protein